MHLPEHQRTPKKLTSLNPHSIYFGFHYSELEVITKSKSWEVDVECSCLLCQSKWCISNWEVLCFCWSREVRVLVPKPQTSYPQTSYGMLGKDEIWGSLFPPLPQSNRVSRYTDKIESWALIYQLGHSTSEAKGLPPVAVTVVEVALAVDQNYFPLLQ